MRRRLPTLWRAAAVLLGALVATPLFYLLAALALGLVPVNADFAPTPLERGGVALYLRSNGVHADLVLPAHEPHDWTHTFPRSEIIDFARAAAPAAAFDWIAFGWGDREFYLTTPTWRELRARTAWRALSGQGRGAMHVEYIARPENFEVERVTVSQNEYRALVDYVRAGFAPDARGGVRRIDHPGFGATDAFYEGTGSYSPWFTSNDWVRRGLAQTGVRTAVWSPFDRALLWQARRLR